MMTRLRVLLIAAFVALATAPASMQTYTVMPDPLFTGLTATGAVCANCKLYTYSAGTSTPLATYSDSSGTPNANPVVLDSAGRATVYLSASSYKFVLKTSADVEVWTRDNVLATHASLTGVSAVESTTDVTFQADSDNNGTNKFVFLDGLDVSKAEINESGDLQIDGDATVGGGDIIGSADLVIRRNTSDGSDSGVNILAGGGANGQSRGGTFQAYGNEHATVPGRVRAVIGTVSGATFEVVDDTGAAVHVLGSTGAATLTSNVANAWTFNSTAGAGGNIRLQRSGTVKGTIGQTVSSGGADDMEVLANAQHLYLTSTSGEIRSLTLYNTTAADSANVFVQSDGTLGRSTSSARFKTEISPLSLTEARLVLGLQPVTFRSLLPRDDAARLFTGFTAEQAAAVSPSYATYGDGEPNGISDRAIIASLLRVIQDLDARVADLEATR